MGEGGGNFGLVVAAFPQQGGQAHGLGHDIEAAIGKEQLEGAGDGTARDLGHERDGKGEPAGVFALGRIDEADGVAVAEHADGNGGLAEKSFELLMGGGNPAFLSFAVG